MGSFRIMLADCNYKETDRCLKEQYINGMKDDTIMTEIIRGLMAIYDTSSVTSGQVLAWTKE